MTERTSSEGVADATRAAEPQPVELFDWEPSYGFCATNTTPPCDLAKAVEAVRRRVCGYSGPTCDCKYGLGSIDGRTRLEQTGCPELRELVHRLIRRPESFLIGALVPTSATELSEAERQARVWRNLYLAAAKSRDELAAELDSLITVMPAELFDALATDESSARSAPSEASIKEEKAVD